MLQLLDVDYSHVHTFPEWNARIDDWVSQCDKMLLAVRNPWQGFMTMYQRSADFNPIGSAERYLSCYETAANWAAKYEPMVVKVDAPFDRRAFLDYVNAEPNAAFRDMRTRWPVCGSKLHTRLSQPSIDGTIYRRIQKICGMFGYPTKCNWDDYVQPLGESPHHGKLSIDTRLVQQTIGDSP